MADELDLDSLLHRHNAAVDFTSSSSPSSDNNDNHRRVDNLLNNSDHNDVVSVRTDSQTLISTLKSFNYDQVKDNLIQRLKSDDYSGYSSRKPFGIEKVADKMGELQSDSASMEEKLQAKKTPLEVAEELEKKQASTILRYFDVNADNPISRAIKSQAFKRDYGTPQVLAVYLNYIALGMSKGVIIVVPSKYSVQHDDPMDSEMLMLGAQGDRSQVPVTSICFNQLGDLLLAGYGDGQIIFWNLPKGTVAKVVTREHKAVVVHALFLGQDSQANRQYKTITGDSKGLLLMHEITVLTLFGFQIKTQCLLDGQRPAQCYVPHPFYLIKLPEVLMRVYLETPLAQLAA